MKLSKLEPKQALNKAFLKVKPLRSDIELFKANLIKLLSKIDEIEREENQKNHIRDFLRDTYYKETNEINTKDYKDLVIHLGKTNKENVGVIIETKRPGNKIEMISELKPNSKSFHEIILYYFDERDNLNNNELKHLIITNVYEWYIFNANDFDKVIYRNAKLKRLYETYRNDRKDTVFFYEEASKIIPEIDCEIPYSYFDIKDYETVIKNESKADDKILIALYKLLSPVHLLKQPFTNDSNSLNQNFYKELLHIIGLEEVKEGSKSIIRRKEKERQPGSFIENAINILKVEDSINNVKEIELYGKDKDEQLFNIALELCLTWINRILFLKLLEGLLITYHKGNKDYCFLNQNTIRGFDELYKLFHQVLAVNIDERKPNIQQKYFRVPYLNSSLFDISELENLTIKINSLDDSESIELISTTVLKEEKRKNLKLEPLEYLFKFLDAYDFASEGAEDIAEDNRTIINASVLGKVFEKINGYKDGSIFTPGFITMYMSRQALRLAVLQKFNDYFKSNGMTEVGTFEELYNPVARIDIKIANDIINSLRICDPAVGSGHFLVSVLNELIVIKYELAILTDRNGKLMKGYEIVVENDELIISDEKGIYEYIYNNKESQRVQETIFNEKQTLIENCLFGVDINPNSVQICRLRLWIELLKSSYYRTETINSNSEPELETLPNIDINIKCGNSLISRFALDSDLKDALKNSKWNISSYQTAVATYRNAKNKQTKREVEKLINDIKSNFETEIKHYDPRFLKLNELNHKLLKLTTEETLFDKTKKEKEKWNKDVEDVTKEVRKYEKIFDDLKNNVIYKNAFEWRFEFPEVLDDEGNFVGFDIMIGNPPYTYRKVDNSLLIDYYKDKYLSCQGNFETYKFFIEKATSIVCLKSGIVCLITSASFLLQNSFEKLRNHILKDNAIKYLIPLGPNIFENVTVDTVIILLQKNWSSNQKIFVAAPKSSDEIPMLSYYSIEQNRFLKNEGMVFDYLLSDKASSIISNLTNKFSLMDEKFDISVGINTGYIKDELTSNHKINEKYHPMVSGTGISRYGLCKPKEWILYDKDFVKSKGKLGRSLPPENYFFSKKILVVRTRNLSLKQRIIATIDENGFYNLNRLTNLISKHDNNLEGLLGFVNSKFFNWIFSTRYYDYEIKPIYLKSCPIADINNIFLIKLVKDVLTKKKTNKNTKLCETLIDLIVYKLYELTYEEVKIVDPEVESVLSQFGLSPADYDRMTIEELSEIKVEE